MVQIVRIGLTKTDTVHPHGGKNLINKWIKKAGKVATYKPAGLIISV